VLRSGNFAVSFYTHVRIHHAVLPCSIQSLIDNPTTKINRLRILRTKYFEYQNGKLAWHGFRQYEPDWVFYSVIPHMRPRPIYFASFLGDNGTFRFYSKVVSHIGKVTGLPVKMIDVTSLTKGTSPCLSEIQAIVIYEIDFSFIYGISQIDFVEKLVPLAAPARFEADAAAANRSVLDMEFYENAARQHCLQNLDPAIPSTFVASAWVPTHLQKLVAKVLCDFHIENGEFLRENGFDQFVRMADSDN